MISEAEIWREFDRSLDGVLTISFHSYEYRDRLDLMESEGLVEFRTTTTGGITNTKIHYKLTEKGKAYKDYSTGL